MRVAMVQIVVGPNPSSNRARGLHLLHQAREQGAELALLPELWTTGYSYLHAEEDGEPAGGLLRDLAGESGLVVGGSVLERRGHRYFNSFRLFSPTGEAAHYDKLHLFPPFGEPEHMTAGKKGIATTLLKTRIGMAICFDLRFPELFRLYAFDGTQIVLVPSAWPSVRKDAWDLFARARAAENQMFLIGVNHAEEPFGGHSLLVGPDGTIRAQMESDEGVLLVDIDPTEADQRRNDFPVLPSLRPEAYHL